MAQKKQRVLVGLSGGVDSAVSAYLLLKAGYEVEGAFMKNWSSTVGLKLAECPWLADRQEALRVAAFLGIPLHTLDFEKEYQNTVMKYFFTEYQAGRTPNPDVMCNKEIKFKLLYNWAMSHGFDFLATGHYAQIEKREKRKEKSLKSSSPLSTAPFSLLRSKDEFKDQTYFIYNITPAQLPRVLFPIGGMKKPEVKKLAARIGLPNAARKESMGLCFVGKVRLKDFLEQKVKAKPGKIFLETRDKRQETRKPGGVSSFVTCHLSLIGQHAGLHNYTIGQRQGINVGGPGGPYFVLRKDIKKNILYVTNDPKDPGLEVTQVQLHSVNWITELGYRGQVTGKSKALTSTLKPLTLLARYRHQGELVPCTVEQTGKGLYTVKFKTPGKALASGQSIVFYKGRICLGGGIIV